MARRYYSSTAVPTTLVLSVTDSQTTFSLTASTGFPSSYPFTLLIDEDTAYEELVTVTAALGGNQFTVTRGSDGTTAQAHSGGAVVRHAFSARDLDEPNAHIEASAAVHGLSGTVVGTTDTQTLTNKTLTSPTVNNPTLVLKQSASPTPTAEGDIQWDTDDHQLKIGDAATTKVISPDNVAATLTNKTISGASNTLSAIDKASITNTAVTLSDTQTLTDKTLTTPTITLKQSATPTPTAEGDIQWDTDDNRLAIGDGAATKIISPDSVTATLSGKTLDSTCTFSVQTGRRNAVINGNMHEAQRGTTAVTADAGYPVDRWFVKKSTSTFSAQQTAHTLGDFANHPRYFLANTVVGFAGAGDYVRQCTQIEDVRTFAGRTVTVSFWAKASFGTPKIGIEFVQSFGTGGSPSADVTGTGTTVTLSTSWVYYQVTYAVPSISGKTVGSNEDSYLQLNMWFTAGSTYNTRAGSIGNQSATFSVSLVQVEDGSVATPFERLSTQENKALCQRYCYAPPTSGSQVRADAGGGATTIRAWMMLPVTMRVAPTATFPGSGTYTVENVLVTTGTSTSVPTPATADVNSYCWTQAGFTGMAGCKGYYTGMPAGLYVSAEFTPA